MHTLEELQSLGAISGSLKVVPGGDAVDIASVVHMGDAEQAAFQGAVVVEDALWVATVSAMPVGQAAVVYSSNGSVVGRWQKQKRTFYKMVLKGETLVTVNSFSLKEVNKMAELDGMGLGGELDLSNVDLTNALAGDGGELGSAKTMTSFDDPGTVKGDAVPEETTDAIVRRLTNDSNLNVQLPESVIRNNYMHGRLFGFITGTDSAVKLSTAKIVKVDGDNRPILNENATPEDRSNLGVHNSKIPNNHKEHEKVLRWRHTRPGPIKGVIVGTPIGTDIPLTYVGDIENVKYDAGKQDLKIYVMDLEVAFAHLLFNYHGTIQESKDVLGNEAGVITCEACLAKKRDKDGKFEQVTRKKFRHDSSKRSSILVEGNYFPLKVYKTIGSSDLRANAEVLNLNAEAVLSKCDVADLREEDAAKFRVNADGSYSTAWFDDGEEIVVAAYYDKDKSLSGMSIPQRVKQQKKNAEGYTYKFEYYEYDKQEDRDAFMRFLGPVKAAKLEMDEFMQLLSKLSSSNKTAKVKRGKGAMSYESYLRGVAANNAVFSNRSLMDIQSRLDDAVS